MCVCVYIVKSLIRVQLFAALWTVACQAPLSKGLSRKEYWNGLPCPPPGDLLAPGIKPSSLTSPALAGRFFTISTTWEAQTSLYVALYILLILFLWRTLANATR